MVNVYVPAAAVPAEKLRLELPPAVTLDGLNDALAPDGTPVMLKLTVWAAPLVTAVLTVYDPLLPCAIVWDDGVAEMLKSLVTTGLIVSETVVV